jgi:hypothetical protein
MGTIFKPFKVWVLKDFINQVIIKSAEVEIKNIILKNLLIKKNCTDEKKKNY